MPNFDKSCTIDQALENINNVVDFFGTRGLCTSSWFQPLHGKWSTLVLVFSFTVYPWQVDTHISQTKNKSIFDKNLNTLHTLSIHMSSFCEKNYFD